jgi:hypothetical protein
MTGVLRPQERLHTPAVFDHATTRAGLREASCSLAASYSSQSTPPVRPAKRWRWFTDFPAWVNGRLYHPGATVHQTGPFRSPDWTRSARPEFVSRGAASEAAWETGTDSERTWARWVSWHHGTREKQICLVACVPDHAYGESSDAPGDRGADKMLTASVPCSSIVV